MSPLPLFLLEVGMASETEICNHALARVGQAPIINIDDGDRLSRICKLHYEAKRDDLLRAYRWKFAINRAEIAALATPPLFGWSHRYRIPVDSLRILSINELDPEFDPDLDFEVWDREGRDIVTDEGPPIKVRYISRVTDPNTFDASFRNSLSAYLAMFIAPSLRETESDIIRVLREDFEFTVAEAKRISAIEGRPHKRRYTRSHWVHGRRGFGGFIR
jgi:hypothetical protein